MREKSGETWNDINHLNCRWQFSKKINYIGGFHYKTSILRI